MEKTLHQLRKKYTLSTTILSGIILLLLFGAFFGMIVVSMNVTVNYTLDVMLEDPLSGVPVRDDMGRRCFIFYYDGAHDEFAALAPYVREFNTYGTKKDQIATAHALGLRKIGDVTTQPDNEQTKGKVAKIIHLIEVNNA